MRTSLRAALRRAALPLLAFSLAAPAAASTLTQNVSWTINRPGTTAKYRIVAYGDSIYAGYNGSVLNAAKYAAPTVNAEYLAAIDSSINVPLDNLEVYYSATRSPDFTVVTEPAVEAQQVYALLDTVLQAVLTDQNADISTLLADAQKQAETIVNDAQAK